jgi:BMFP domain-containing protein YqiC
VSTSNSLVLGAIKGVNGATASTNVGIGTTAPAFLLHVNGEAAKPGGGVWAVASDERLKRNVSAFTDGLEVLTKVKPVWFEYNGEAGMPTEKRYVGVIAQQMQKIAPYMVGSFSHQDTRGKKADYLDYDANALTYILVNAVQQLKKEKDSQIETLKQENATQMEVLKQEKDTQIEVLKQENETLEARLTRLENLLNQQPGASATKTSPESADGARLWQNVPNPTDGTTLIRYSIPQQARQAQISLYSLKGELLQSFPLTQRGEGEISINTTTLPEGVYVYRLLIEGKQVDAKKLLRQR